MRLVASALVLVAGGAAAADPTSGVDGALFRSSYDTGGVFAVEGARLMPAHDLSFKVLVGYARAPLQLAVPGIGDDGADRILNTLVTIDMAFGVSLTRRLALGLDVAAYRTDLGAGYGRRGRYMTGGALASRSTGLIALRPLSNIDASASPSDETSYLGDGRAGPLDARAGLKLMLVDGRRVALTAIGSVFLPFGEDEVLLGDRSLVLEPKLALDVRLEPARASRLVLNAGARFRQRSVLEGYDALDPMASDADAQVILDVGSELVLGLGGMIEVAPRVLVGAEAQAFVPLPAGASWGTCRRYSGARCATIGDDDYFAGARAGDLTLLGTVGAMLRISADVTASVMGGTGQLGARGEDVRVTTGLVWSPQPAGVAAPGRRDRDGDGIPDGVDSCADDSEDRDRHQDEDGCPDLDNDGDGLADTDDRCADEPEDKDGFEDADGCVEADNDGDRIADAADRCPDQAEDVDGFEDDDGCVDPDNDGDGVPDARDACRDDAETVNGFDDDDGCPDSRSATGPQERADRIDLGGTPVAFTRGTATLTAAGKQLLDHVAALIKSKQLAVRVEVRVALGTTSKRASRIAAQQRTDKALAERRAQAIAAYLATQGVQVPAAGVGSSATEPFVERVDFLKVAP